MNNFVRVLFCFADQVNKLKQISPVAHVLLRWPRGRQPIEVWKVTNCLITCRFVFRLLRSLGARSIRLLELALAKQPIRTFQLYLAARQKEKLCQRTDKPFSKAIIFHTEISSFYNLSHSSWSWKFVENVHEVFNSYNNLSADFLQQKSNFSKFISYFGFLLRRQLRQETDSVLSILADPSTKETTAWENLRGVRCCDWKRSCPNLGLIVQADVFDWAAGNLKELVKWS